MIERKDLDSFSTYLLAKEAEKRGAKVSRIFPETKKSYLRIVYNGQIETIIGQRISRLSFNAHMICKNKEMTRRFLRENGISTTEGNFFTRDEIEKAVDYANTIGYPVVTKYLDETWGRGVSVGIKNDEELRSAAKKLIQNKFRFLVEKQFEGNEYRILATREKLLGIINRIPANVVGDGKKNIKELIEIKNQDSRRGDNHEKSLVKIKIDEDVENNLKEQNLDLNCVLNKTEKVFLRKTSNLSQGGDSIDVTDDAHPKVKELAPKVISAIPDLPYAGFDFMTTDISKDPNEMGYAIIEINESPMLSMHHIPYIGKERDVAKDMLDLIFEK